MPNLENHMDELFQKAAENYPLKTDTGNFDDILPFIAGKTAATAKPAVAKTKRKTALLLLAFFVTSVLIGTYLINNTLNNKPVTDKVVLLHKTTTSAYNKSSAQHNKNNVEPVAGNAVTENIVTKAEIIFQKNRPAYNSKGNMFINITAPVSVTDNVTEAENNIPATRDATIIKPTAETENHREANTVKINTETKKEIIDQPGKKDQQNKGEPNPAAKKNKNNPVLYYGIAVGVELNKVKSQHMAQAGFNGGLILGLQINKKLAVETGVQLSQKKYYSDGKYFKPKAGSMPANMTVTSLQSSSTIIEIPVSVKYNFSKKKNTLYGKAGISNYIITKEINKYQAVVSGQQQEINSTYKTNNSYFASDVRISAGYQHKVGKKLNILVEPYIQIPLKGIGIGTLPVKSAGLQLVLTRN